MKFVDNLRDRFNKQSPLLKGAETGLAVAFGIAALPVFTLSGPLVLGATLGGAASAYFGHKNG